MLYRRQLQSLIARLLVSSRLFGYALPEQVSHRRDKPDSVHPAIHFVAERDNSDGYSRNLEVLHAPQ